MYFHPGVGRCFFVLIRASIWGGGVVSSLFLGCLWTRFDELCLVGYVISSLCLACYGLHGCCWWALCCSAFLTPLVFPSLQLLCLFQSLGLLFCAIELSSLWIVCRILVSFFVYCVSDVLVLIFHVVGVSLMLVAKLYCGLGVVFCGGSDPSLLLSWLSWCSSLYFSVCKCWIFFFRRGFICREWRGH